MQEIIHERPGGGSRYKKYKNFRRREEGGFRGMRKPYGYDCKHMNWSNGPLKGFLRANIGRPWDKVWSEICERADSRSFLGYQLRDNFRWIVETQVVIEDGVVYAKDGHRKYKLERNGFYVHPETGLLCYVSSDGKIKHQKPTSKIVRLHGMEFYKHEGVWYQVTTVPIPSKRPKLPVWRVTYKGWYDHDAFGHTIFNWNYMSLHSKSCYHAYGESVYVISKKQIGKRLIKKIEKHINE